MTDPKLDLSRAPRIADMINAWFCPQCGLRDETMRGIDQDGTCSSCGSDCCTWDSVRGHLAHYGWEVVSADDARELYRIRAEATATLCYEGDCAKMTGRARPCPVHDAQPPLPTRAAQYPGECTVHQKARDDLSTERAAREKAEAELQRALTAELEQARAYAAACEKTAMLNQQENVELKLELAAERAAREELDADWKRRHTEWLDKALVDAQWHRDQRQQAERERDMLSEAFDKSHARELQAERERDAALARVKEWEQAYDSNGFGPQSPAEVQVFLRERDRVNGHAASLRVSAAESALASARELISSPAPERSDKRSRWNELGELPVTVMATSEYPSPAPCSGCAAARELLLLWYHARGFAESGETVDAVTMAWLKEHGE